jgi:PTS system nitrogen regulatory IIA component
MQLTVREAATYFGVDETTLRKWIRTRGIPVHRVDERMLLNAIEVWEWAVEHGVPVSRRLLESARREPEVTPPLSSLLVAGGIHYDIPGDDTSAVFREVVARLPLPADVDREFLVTVLESREAMGSTGIGHGIAIPHVRNPILLHVPSPFVALCLLRRPVDFGAIDAEPVRALFLVISPTVPTHLRILAQLGFVLRDQELRQLLSRSAPADEIIARVQVLEGTVSGTHRAVSGA